jgi:hypothetical protein
LTEKKDRTAIIAYEVKFPARLSYDNCLVGVMQQKRNTSFNFIMSNGDKTDYPCNDGELTEALFPKNVQIRRIRIRELIE